MAFPYRYKIKRTLFALLSSHRGPDLSGSGSCEGCARLFQDKVKTHQLAYVTDGIAHQSDDSGLQKLYKKGRLVQVTSGRFYFVQPLSYSKPLLLPKGHAFIEELGRRYYEKCKADSVKYIPFTISSLTRSNESVRRLMKSNSNSIKNSAHLKGKTFDVNYRAFNNNHTQTKIFIDVLNDLRLKRKCYVKFERNGCLHITVI